MIRVETTATTTTRTDTSSTSVDSVPARTDATTIRVVLPAHLRTLARVEREVRLSIDGVATQRAVLDALEAAYPMLGGTIRGQTTKLRRPLVRFFACGEDLSHTSPDDPLPERVASGAEPFVVIGAMAGG